MIAKGKSISHGTSAINYSMTKDKSKLISIWGMSEVLHIIEEPKAYSLANAMIAHQNIWRRSGKTIPQKSFFRFEVSPSADESKNFTTKDWQQLAYQFIKNFDEKTSECSSSKKRGKRLQDCQIAVVLHRDTSTPHLHIIVNRVTSDGSIIGAHNVGKRAMDAANIINKEKGWMLSRDVGNKRKQRIHSDALDILKSMGKFEVKVYFEQMRAKGYTINAKRDSRGKYVAYSIGDGRACFQSSKLGYGRDLTLSRIETTWNKLHVVSIKQRGKVEYIYTTDYNARIPFSIPMELDDIIQKNIIVPDEEWDDDDLDDGEEWEEELADRPRVARAAAAMLIGLMLPNGYDGVVAATGGGGVHGELTRWDGLEQPTKDTYIQRAKQAAIDASNYYRPNRKSKNCNRRR